MLGHRNCLCGGSSLWIMLSALIWSGCPSTPTQEVLTLEGVVLLEDRTDHSGVLVVLNIDGVAVHQDLMV
jgi:hypothetical protein